MKLYYSKGACSLIVRIILNELNLPFKDEAVNLKAKTYQADKDFKKINPKGSVPVLELDDGNILTENAVILQYLADNFAKHHLLPGLNIFERYRVLEWLNFIATDIHKGFSPLFNPNIPTTIKTDIFKPTLKTKFAYIDHGLQNQQFLYLNQFTVPDAYLYVMMRWSVGQHMDLKDLTHLIQYSKRLDQRDSIKRSLAQEELTPLDF